ncbi:hypothetical protein ASD11_10205 [Aeromicrobium sp. Root495]|uniref:hypothetical protein n=1 Tax=Aeromicrobium sp. Root495 TaxID=1736550 RepID=UPI0006FFA18D|nr:hypothetical protein [Aeromicrobium sp. Root495]KQY59881.1 hypothetical protein ASD11_10205 [Aeromicrobium sp. Root495]
MGSDVLLVGCGDLNAAVGLRLAEQGRRVVGIRRRAELVPAPIEGLSADLTSQTPMLPSLDLDLLVVALTARPRSEDSYRATYVDGLGRALDAVAAAGLSPRRAVLVSSTGVMADGPVEALLDETTAPDPRDPPAEMLLQSEQLFAERLPHGTVLRLSGLYGHGEPRLVDQVRRGAVGDPDRWTNRIHRDDAADAILHLLTMEQEPEPLYLGTDDEPSQLGDVAAFVAARLGAPAPQAANPAQGRGKRLSNARLRATGWAPRFPTYREGYAEHTR